MTDPMRVQSLGLEAVAADRELRRQRRRRARCRDSGGAAWGTGVDLWCWGWRFNAGPHRRAAASPGEPFGGEDMRTSKAETIRRLREMPLDDPGVLDCEGICPLEVIWEGYPGLVGQEIASFSCRPWVADFARWADAIRFSAPEPIITPRMALEALGSA